MLYGHLYDFFGEMCIYSLADFLLGCLFFGIELYYWFVCVEEKFPIGILARIFFPFRGLSFSFTDGFLCCVDAFNVY